MRSPYKFACARCAARCIPNCSASKLRDGKQAMLYKYDQLNRITKSRSLAFGNGNYAARSGEQKYDEDYSYNADGGLTSLQRRDETAQLKNDFAYSYYANTHRIQKLSAAGGIYEYNAIGNLIKNNREGTTIAWTPSGKVRTVTKADTVTTYRYGFNGKRKDNRYGRIAKYDYGFRIYSPEDGVFLSVDPLQRKYPNLSPYGAFENNPIYFKDPDGKDAIYSIKGNTITFTSQIYIVGLRSPVQNYK